MGFLAPDVPPLPLDQRVFRASSAVRACFDRLLAANRLVQPPLTRVFATHAALSELVPQIFVVPVTAAQPGVATAEVWWHIEQRLRRDRVYCAGLLELCELGAVSRASLVRSCRRATGQSPMTRLRELRLEEARGLLLYSALTISEIAAHLGYPPHDYIASLSLTNAHPVLLISITERRKAMENKHSSSRACMTAIKALRRLILEEYQAGGWLPGGRDMALRLKVSHMTYCKALNRMTKEGFVRSFPKKGHYVTPEHLRCRKIGLIIEAAEPSPFLAECQSLAAIFRHLSERGFDAQIIQGSSFDQLHDIALAHGVEGLLWRNPPLKAAPWIEQIDAAGELPLVVIQGHYLGPGVMLGKGCVTTDTMQTYRERAKLMLSRGHRSVAYLGNDHRSALELGLVAAFQAGGVALPPELCIKNLPEEPGKLARILVSHRVTGLLTEGSGERVERLFAELSALPQASRPEVLASRFPLLPSLFLRYPKVTPVPATEWTDDFGEVATRMLLAHLLDGKPLSQVRVGIRFQS